MKNDTVTEALRNMECTFSKKMQLNWDCTGTDVISLDSGIKQQTMFLDVIHKSLTLKRTNKGRSYGANQSERAVLTDVFRQCTTRDSLMKSTH